MLRGVCNRKAFSKPTFIRLPKDMMSCMTIMGTSTGISICSILCQVFAPSTFAASWRETSTLERVAR